MSNSKDDQFTGYSTVQIGKILDKSPQTIRNWTDEFARFLSPLATVGEGRTRIYNLDDVAVFQLVKQLRDNGFRPEEITAALTRGERGEVNAADLVIAPQHETGMRQLELEMRMIIKERDRLQEELDTAFARLEEMDRVREENIRLKARLEVQEEYAERRLSDTRTQYEQQLAQTAKMYMQVLDELRTRIDAKDEKNEALLRELTEEKRRIGRIYQADHKPNDD